MRDDSWMTITDTKSSDEEDGEGDDDGERIHGTTMWRGSGSGSQDRIVRDNYTSSTVVANDDEKDGLGGLAPGGSHGGSGSATDSRIMKTTQFSIRYDDMSLDEERDMAYNRLGLRPPRG